MTFFDVRRPVGRQKNTADGGRRRELGVGILRRKVASLCTGIEPGRIDMELRKADWYRTAKRGVCNLRTYQRAYRVGVMPYRIGSVRTGSCSRPRGERLARRVNGPEELILLASVWDECTLTEDVLMKKGRRCRRHVRVRTTAHNGPKKPLAPNKDYVVRHRRVSWSL